MVGRATAQHATALLSAAGEVDTTTQYNIGTG